MARIGLVLGAGGVVGGAFHAGVLSALEEATGWDPRTAELILGTSAGSVSAALLRAGFSAADIAARTAGTPISAEGAARLRSAGLPPGQAPAVPQPDRSPRKGSAGPAAPGVLWAAARRPWSVRPPAVLAGLIPEGGLPTTTISEGVDALLGDSWPAAPLWIAAVRLDDGRLVIFGRDPAPAATPAEAVAASCAVPGWFTPVRIRGVRYVDGGAHSLTNVAEVARSGPSPDAPDLDLVLVSAPMGRTGPGGLPGAWRRVARAQLAVEAGVLRRRGVPVVAFQPSVEDQAVMGRDAMDASRRTAVVQQVRASTRARLRRPDLAALLAVLTATRPTATGDA